VSQRLRRLRELYEARFDSTWETLRAAGLGYDDIEAALIDIFVDAWPSLADPSADDAWFEPLVRARVPASPGAEDAGPPDDETRKRVLDNVALTISGGHSPDRALRTPAILIGGGMALSLLLAIVVAIAVSWRPDPAPDEAPALDEDAEERVRLDELRAAIDAGDRARAESLLADYDLRFERGALRGERDALARSLRPDAGP
jgi:hypothetical protein